MKAAELRKKLLAQAGREVKEKLSGDEAHLIKAVGLMQSLDEISNILFEQVSEWYSLYFPELGRKVKEPDTYLKLVYNLSEKENFRGEGIKKYIENDEKAAEIEKLPEKSVGGKAGKEAMAEIKLLALNTLNLREEKKYLAKYSEATAKKVMPNFSHIAGGVLSGKMLAKAGSLKKLALMPSSALQILGADKAIFAHLRSGAKSPKYGLLFQHPLVGSATRKHKGKVAKLVAAKLTVCAKADYLSGRFIAGELKKELDKKVSALG
jgi:nucleolar protein 56